MYSFSIEQLGTTVYAYLTPTGSSNERATGEELEDFDLQFLDPDLVDITNSTAITVEEYDADESDTHGGYRFAVPLPATGEGNYSLRIEDSFGDFSYCVFMAYNFPPHGNTGDDTPQIEIEAYDTNQSPVETLSLDDVDLYIFNPSMELMADSVVGATMDKIEDGRFVISWDASSEEGEWFMDVIHPTYFAGGQQGFWRYVDPESYAPPSIDSTTVSDDLLSVLVALTAGDAPFIVAQLLATDGTVRDEDIRSGSGAITLTRTLVESGIVLAFGSDANGDPAGSPVAELIVTTLASSGAADDNVPVAIRVMKANAVLWPLLGIDDFGKPTYGDLVLIDCRWDVVREEFIGPNGDREMSKARLIVDRDIDVKGVLLLGTLADVVDVDDPKNNDGAWEVRQFSKTANFKGNKYLREVYL